jgi:choline kinase/phosphatidylglycerophosphate synthase
MSVQQAVIFAAGDGERMRDYTARPKVLLPMGGRTMLKRHLTALSALGLREFVLVVGYRSGEVERFVRERGLDRRYRLHIERNPEWELGNARSLWAARHLLAERFMVVMGDHVYNHTALQGLLDWPGDFVGVFDSRPRFEQSDEATRAWVENGRVVRLGKDLEEFNALDAGIFVCSRRVLGVLKQCLAEGQDEWNAVKCAWIRQVPLWVFDLDGAFWADLDTPTDVNAAAQALVQQLPKPRDGIVARLLNRRISIPLSQRLTRTALTPDHITLLSFLLAVGGALAFALGTWGGAVVGGLLAQASSILDGCDGEVARLRASGSARGAWTDSLLDRWADALILAGMAYGFATAHTASWVWGLAFLALAGAYSISYSESRYKSAFGQALPYEGGLPAKRDVRLFLALLGGLLNAVPLALALIAVLSFAEVFRRLWRYGVRSPLRG